MAKVSVTAESWNYGRGVKITAGELSAHVADATPDNIQIAAKILLEQAAGFSAADAMMEAAKALQWA